MKLLKKGTISFIAAVLLIGCGGGGGSISSSTSNVSGKVVDGPIYKAKVCVDYNFNGICDSDEPTATTDINGTYQLKKVNLNALAPIIVIPQKNTIDTFTNKSFTKKLSAPLDGTKVNITPITTLIGAQLYKLKQNNNLNHQTIRQLKENLAKSLGINADITKIDPLEDPKLAAVAVMLLEVCPDENQNFEDLEEKIDIQKLKEGNLKEAIKDDTLKHVLQNIIDNKNINKLKDPKKIQVVIQRAIEDNNPDLLKQPPVELKKIALEDILTSNVFYKQNDEGYYIQFYSDGTLIDYEYNDDNDKVVKYTGNWKIVDDGSVEIDYSDGSKVTFNIEQMNPYIFKVYGIDSDGNNFEDKVLALPNQFLNNSQVVNIQNLPGITPLKAADFVGKYFRVDYNDFVYFDKNGVAIETDDEGKKATYKWSVENGILIISGNNSDNDKSFTAYIVRFDNYLFIYNNEDNLSSAWIATMKDIMKNAKYNKKPNSSNTRNNGIIEVSNIVSGKIIFYDENGNQISVPKNAKIRITPQRYQIEDVWVGVNCLINSNGTFGDKCYVFNYKDNIVEEMKEALKTETTQIAIYNDENDDYNWEKDEHSYYVEENISISNLNEINLNVTIDFSKIANVDDFLNYIDFEPMNISDSLFKDKILFITGNDRFVLYPDKKLKYYEGNSEPGNGTWKIEKNVLVLSVDANEELGSTGFVRYEAIKNKNGSILETGSYDKYDDLKYKMETLINNYSTINSVDDVLNIIDNEPESINEDDVLDTIWEISDGEKNGVEFDFSNDYTFKIYFGEKLTGTWKVEKNVIVLSFNNNGYNFKKGYLIPISVEKNDDNYIKWNVIVLFTNDNNKIENLESCPLNKIQ